MSYPSHIDLNADLGESFGRYSLDDVPLLDVITSANVACGFHAGDPVVMRETVRRAARKGVTIGAHPGYPDLMGFGRRDLAATPDEVSAYVLYQLGALQACCAAEGARVRYVKPHGALYNRAAKDETIAEAIVEAVRRVDPELGVLGLGGSALVTAAERGGLRAVCEGFVDRGYQADGTLVPRGSPGAIIEDPEVASARALRMVRAGVVETVDGTLLPMKVDSLCTHGDGPHALALVRAVRARLHAAGVHIAPFLSDD